MNGDRDAEIIPDESYEKRGPVNAIEAAQPNERAKGRVLLPKRWKWDRSIPRDDQELVIEQLLRLPSWVDGQLDSQNLDVKKLNDRDGLWRLRVGDYRAVFQPISSDVVLHRVFRRKEDNDYSLVDKVTLVRSGDALRTLVTEQTDQPVAVPPSRHPIVRPARRDVVQNALSVFSNAELRAIGLGDPVLDELRRVPPELLPDVVLAKSGLGAELIRFVAELWERPGEYAGKELRHELVALGEREAAERLASEYSTTSLVAIEDAKAFLALLDADIEDWMVYLHPSQLGAVRRTAAGPSRIRGGAGTGKTAVALHRARYLADETGGEILLTTFVKTLPKVWEHLLTTFPEPVKGRIWTRSVDQLALELYSRGGGRCDIADTSQRRALIREIWSERRQELAGLTQIGLEEEFDHMIIGRSIDDFDGYAQLLRAGRGTRLPAAARVAVWDGYEEYARRMSRAKLTYWPELRRDALKALREGRATKRYDAIVADEAQDLGQTAVHMLAEMAGGLPDPNLTLVGDGQQAIYPGGFSLLELGVDVRGRATVLRTNWRNTYAIWAAARAFIEGEAFDDLDEELSPGREAEESPLPMRDGRPPGLWIAQAGEDASLAAEIVREAIEEGADAGDTVVLAPTNAQVDRLRSALKAAGIPNADLSRYEGVHQPEVWVGTFHRVKGLEFKHAVVTGLSAAVWPPKRQDLDPAAREEARARDVRAAFVAMTRARDRLDVVVAEEAATELARAAWAFDQR
jgi:mRNA-degrading endonuclease RelE of RelBE toxin-antitoxin system